MAAATPPKIHHELIVKVDPKTQLLEVRDAIRMPKAWREKSTHFLLSDKLELDAVQGRQVSAVGEVPDKHGPHGYRSYTLRPPSDEEDLQLVLRYRGKIDHPMARRSSAYRGGYSSSAGTISNKGVYLGGSSVWIPYFEGTQSSFSMTVILPKGWHSLSQGKRTRRQTEHGHTVDHWQAPQPTEAIYLLAGPWQEYRDGMTTGSGRQVALTALLRQDDPKLAKQFIERSGIEIARYEALIGPYPYSKFTLAENFWQSGYGMPSFTLMGSRVIRLPFILNSSYPHEILHNWFGNGVFVDYAKGNWSEGLTAYLADHLLQELKDQGISYRHRTLTKYSGYVRQENDFALVDFRSRHDGATQAVGYGKGLMFFHMLRKQVGDDAFIAGLRHFYKKNRFKSASYSDIHQAFEEATGVELKAFFSQWTQRPGAPKLQMENVALERENPNGSGRYVVRFDVRQLQDRPFTLELPIEVQLDGIDAPQTFLASLSRSVQTVRIPLPARPLRVDLDPNFDLFRQLSARELPPTFSTLFGGKKLLAILPSKAAPQERAALKKLVQAWKLPSTWDDAISSLPKDRSIWILGRFNRFRNAALTPLKAQGVMLEKGLLTIGKQRFAIKDLSIALASNHQGQSIAWFAPQHGALKALLRKMPHYGSFGHALFQGDKAQNILRGRWQQLHFPLARIFDSGGRALTVQHPLLRTPEPKLIAAP
uniref:Putative Aminopeptidase n=1 Tax=Magnetococcus massalia (strain MO-1) TaxID=451514 RepID=A0A1S7LIT4_MAGMO|nr:putative Aminopeptidase [Candidatus Magnetococcus massalia]